MLKILENKCENLWVSIYAYVTISISLGCVIVPIGDLGIKDWTLPEVTKGDILEDGASDIKCHVILHSEL